MLVFFFFFFFSHVHRDLMNKKVVNFTLVPPFNNCKNTATNKGQQREAKTQKCTLKTRRDTVAP